VDQARDTGGQAAGGTQADRPQISIRVAKSSDLAAAAELESRCFDAYSLSHRRLQYLAGRSSAIVLAAEEEGRLVGEAVGLLRHHKRGLTGRVYSLVVDPTMRGRGVGKRLMAELLAKFVEREVGRVYLEVEQTNASAIALYEKMGFCSIGTIDDYYGQGRTAVHMMCETGVKPRLPRPLAA
jgi:ribosomal protein S18 acetylase RimI-like enzyme